MRAKAEPKLVLWIACHNSQVDRLETRPQAVISCEAG